MLVLVDGFALMPYHVSGDFFPRNQHTPKFGKGNSFLGTLKACQSAVPVESGSDKTHNFALRDGNPMGLWKVLPLLHNELRWTERASQCAIEG